MSLFWVGGSGRLGAKKLQISQQKEKADKTSRYGGEGMCVHGPFTDPEQTKLCYNVRVNEIQTKVRVSGLFCISSNKKKTCHLCRRAHIKLLIYLQHSPHSTESKAEHLWHALIIPYELTPANVAKILLGVTWVKGFCNRLIDHTPHTSTDFEILRRGKLTFQKQKPRDDFLDLGNLGGNGL